LIRDIHSADRIERLCGNPMLLTTMALVKREVGKLPSRRDRLYAHAVQVLLRWRSEVDEPLDPLEALPQLEYVAAAMCQQGIQRLREDELLDLVVRMRTEYPQVYSVQTHMPREFVRLLEARTGMLVDVGVVRHNGLERSVYEFRHLTFQEYLAGLALVEGHVPGSQQPRSVADRVAHLAGQIRQVDADMTGDGATPGGEVEVAVVDNWREARRLCVASCNTADVDEVLAAILTPLPDEVAQVTARPRVVLAALCLADEPHAKDSTVWQVLRGFVAQIDQRDEQDRRPTTLQAAVVELARSRWAEQLRGALLEEFQRRDARTREAVASMVGLAADPPVEENRAQVDQWIEEQISKVRSGDEPAAIQACLALDEFARRTMFTPEGDRLATASDLLPALLARLGGPVPTAHARAVA